MAGRHVLVLVGLVAVAGCAPDSGHVIHVIAEQAPGLRTNARVQYLGADVGRVREVYFTSGGVRIDLAIDRDVPIRQRDVVRLMSTSAFGPQTVAIEPGDPQAPLMRAIATPHVHAASMLGQPGVSLRRVARRLGLVRADTLARASRPLTAQPERAPH